MMVNALFHVCANDILKVSLIPASILSWLPSCDDAVSCGWSMHMLCAFTTFHTVIASLIKHEVFS